MLSVANYTVLLWHDVIRGYFQSPTDVAMNQDGVNVFEVQSTIKTNMLDQTQKCFRKKCLKWYHKRFDTKTKRGLVELFGVVERQGSLPTG